MNKYPTKKEILEKKMKFSKAEINYILKWKNYWKITKKNKKLKIKMLKLLIEELNYIRKKEKITIQFDPRLYSACYIPQERTIILNNESIISALHEFAHSIYGASELKACAYSVHLFKATFPMAYKKLQWKGHQLFKLNKITDKSPKRKKYEQNNKHSNI